MANQLITKRKLQQATTGYAIALIAIIALGGYWGYQNYNEYQSTHQAFLEESDNLNTLKTSAEKAKADFLALKNDLKVKNSSVDQSIEKIFPSNEDFTTLARQLDEYFRNTAVTDSPMFLSDLRFNQSRNDKDTEYGTLPFSINLSGNENGFKKFLNYAEKSGDLNGNTRLMDINSINLNLVPPAQNTQTSTSGSQAVAQLDQPKDITASVNLKSYFQKPLEISTNNN